MIGIVPSPEEAAHHSRRQHWHMKFLVNSVKLPIATLYDVHLLCYQNSEKKRSEQTAFIVERFMDDVGHLLGKIMKCQWQAGNPKLSKETREMHGIHREWRTNKSQRKACDPGIDSGLKQFLSPTTENAWNFSPPSCPGHLDPTCCPWVTLGQTGVNVRGSWLLEKFLPIYSTVS